MEHAAQRERLLQMSQSEMAKRHLQSLLNGYRNGELSAEDIYQYTTIDPSDLERLLHEKTMIFNEE